MRIDTHQHFWKFNEREFSWIPPGATALRQDRLPEHRQSSMQAYGVTRAIAVQARTSATETDFLLELAQHESSIAGVIGWVDLRAKDLEEHLMIWRGQRALKGFRHVLQDEPNIEHFLTDAHFRAGVCALQERGHVYEVLVRGGAQLAAVRDFCALHDRHWLVLDHLGKPELADWTADHQQRWRKALREIGALPHVICKLSGLATETSWSTQRRLSPADVAACFTCMDDALEVFGADRLLFGSDWPVCELATPYEAVFALAEAWAASRLSEGERRALWSENAVRCYGL